MSTINVEHLNARRTELHKGLEALRGELGKLEEARNTTVSQMQQLMGAIQILNELLEPEETSAPSSEVVES